MKYRPLFGNVLAKPIKPDDTIILPDGASEDPIRAEIVETSKNDYNSEGLPIPLLVRPNMVIHFNERDGIPVLTEEGTWYVVNQRDILLVEED